MGKIDIRNLYKVTKNDINKCAKTLTQAFAEDKRLQQLAGEKNTKKRMQSLYRFIVRASLKRGHVYASGPEMEGIVLWFPEGVTRLTTYDFFTCGGIGMILRHGFGIPIRMLRYENRATGIHQELIKEPHWYLFILAVVPEHRKKGFASRMMRPFLSFFDENKISCYLETGKGNNEFMYKHYGFEVVERKETANGQFLAMIRKPKGIEN